MQRNAQRQLVSTLGPTTLTRSPGQMQTRKSGKSTSKAHLRDLDKDGKAAQVSLASTNRPDGIR